MKRLSRENFEKLRLGVKPEEIGMDTSEVIQVLCELVNVANQHMKRVQILQNRYNKLDDFVCNEIMKSCLALKGGVSEKESITNIFKFYEENCA